MEFTKEKPLRVVTLCSGYDAQCLALRDAEIPFDLVAWSEIDKHAIVAHNALFPEYADRNLGDMTKIDWTKVPDFDLLTYSTPCQSISLAGQQHGIAKGSGTRSSILWNVEDCIAVKRPRFLQMENVAALVSKKFLPFFNSWQALLETYGYTNYAKVLNSKDYGVPQNRERIFVVSIHESADMNNYYFPEPIPLTTRLIDVLEKNVDEKYYVDANVEKALNIIGKKEPDDTILGSLQGHASTQPIEGGITNSYGNVGNQEFASKDTCKRWRN